MPMEMPWRTSYVPGDYIFGYASSIGEFIRAHRNEGATDECKIQVLDTDRFGAFDGRGKKDDKEAFFNSVERHPKYAGVLSDSGKDFRAPALAGLKPGAVKNNREWRIKSKASLYWLTMDAKRHVHFVLDGIDMREVVHKTHFDGPLHGQDTPHNNPDTKTRTITHAELRWLYRNKVFPQVRAYVQFWLGNNCVEPPWRTDPGLWGLYVPRNSPSTPGIEHELD